MTHARIESIISQVFSGAWGGSSSNVGGGSPDKLRELLEKVRVSEMKSLLNMKKLESEIALLKLHTDRFKERFEDLTKELQNEI
jgi:hypothetical protein